MRLPALITALLLACASAASQADVYRWVDANGGVHYSDVPVEGAVIIRITTAKSSGNNSNASTNASTNAYASRDQAAALNSELQDRRASEAAARSVKDDVAKVQGEECKKATTRYEQSIKARRLYKAGKDGARIYLTDAELDRERLDARTAKDAFCGVPKH